LLSRFSAVQGAEHQPKDLFYTMPRAEQYKRRVPLDLQGIVIDGMKLGTALYVPLRDGMTRAKAMVFSEDLIVRAKARVNYKLTDVDAWELAMSICDQHEAFRATPRDQWTLGEELDLFIPGKGPDARGWLRRMGRNFSIQDQGRVAQWVERVRGQRFRAGLAASLMDQDDPEALIGQSRADRAKNPTHSVKSVRAALGRGPLHSEVTRDYFASKRRPKNYRRALEQFRERVGDLEVNQYTPEHVWEFRNWLNETRDEKKGEVLAGKTKNNKLSAVSSLFGFAIEKRYRNDNPTRDVTLFPKNENVKKHRRLYTKTELTALFVKGKRATEWQYWAPLLGIYAGVRITEAIQLRPFDISHEFGVWHILIRPGRGQIVKGGRARVVPIHKELIRLGLIDLHKQAMEQQREWLLKDVPLVKKPGNEYNAPDVETIMVPSQNSATQWFGRYSDVCGVSDPNVDFHALRGAFITYGSQMGKDLSLRMEIAGHSKGSSVHSTYIYAGASLKALKREIDAIEYPIRIPR
jgi:integrase